MIIVMKTGASKDHVSLPGDFSCLQRDGLAAVLEGLGYWIHFSSPILNMTTGKPFTRQYAPRTGSPVLDTA